MGLATYMDGLRITHGLRPVRSFALGDRLVRLSPFGGDQAAESLTGVVYRIFAEDDDRSARDLYRAVDEIVENVLEYSGNDAGFLALQQYPKLSEVAFAIADSGVGLRSTLIRRMNVKDDAEALFYAAQPTTSGSNLAGRGRGIGRVIKTVNSYKGRVVLLSGNASGKFEDGRLIPEVTRYAAPFCGTVAQARMQLHGVSR